MEKTNQGRKQVQPGLSKRIRLLQQLATLHRLFSLRKKQFNST